MIEASGSAIRLNIDFAASSEGLGRSAHFSMRFELRSSGKLRVNVPLISL